MDWNRGRRLEKCPSRPQKGLVNRGSVSKGNLHPPGENVDELLELLSSLDEDLSSSLTSPVIDEGGRNAGRSRSILRQRNVFRQVEPTSLKSGQALPAREGRSNRAAHPEAISAKARTVRFSDVERHAVTTPSRPCYTVEGDTLQVQMEYEELDSGGHWQMWEECSGPASPAQLHSHKAPEKSQNFPCRDTEFDAPLSELFGKQQADFDTDWADSRHVDYAGQLCEDDTETLSELHSLLESSWTSASLHRSMLDLEVSEQLLMFELGPVSPKAEGDFPHLDTLESDTSASYKANTPGSFSQCQRRESSCRPGCVDSSSGTPAARREDRVTDPLHRSDAVINNRPRSQLVRPHSARTLDTPRVPTVLSQSESGSGSQRQAGGAEDALSVRGTASDQYVDKHCSVRKALFPPGFGRGETSVEGRSSKDCVKLSCESLIREESHFDKEESCSYFHPTGTRTMSPSLAVYHASGSTEVPHFLFGNERLTTEENFIKDTNEVRMGELRYSHFLICPQDCGDVQTTFVEMSLGRQNGRTSEPHALSGTFSHMDKLGLVQPPSTACALKESAFRDSDGAPGNKRQEVEPRGKGLTAHHQSWKLPDAAEVWHSGSVVTVGQRFLARGGFRLLSRCFLTWSHRQRCQAAARRQHGRRVLKRGLGALRWAVTLRRMQEDAVATRRRAALLSQCFGRWKACFEQKRFSAVVPGQVSDVDVEALRRRLIHPSEGLVLRVAYCAWRRHFQGLQLHRAALIHYHLSLLFKHWLEWRRRKMFREAKVQLEQQAQVQHNSRLKGQALFTWRLAWGKACRAQLHHRACCLAAVWRRWVGYACRARERRQQKSSSQGLHRRALLQPSFCHWWTRAELQRGARDRQGSIARVAVLRWKATVKRKRLDRLYCKTAQLLTKRTLSAALGTWRRATSAAALEQRQVWEGRHLLAGRTLRAAFGSWRRGCGARAAARALQERLRKARLAQSLRAWRSVVHQRGAWQRCCSARGALCARRCLQRWRQALELSRLRVAFISAAFQRRRQLTRGRRGELRWGAERWGESEPIASPQWSPLSSLDLQLHHAFHSWKDSTRHLQLARLHRMTQELAQVRAALQQWHRLAQQALCAQVHSFCSQLDPAPCLGPESTPPAGLFLGPSVTSQQVLALTEGCSGRGESLRSGGYPAYPSTGLSASSGRETETGRPLVASPPPGPHPAGEREGYEDRAPSPGTFRPPDQRGRALNARPRLKGLVVGALGRIRRGSLAVAFCQWRALVRVSRGQRALLHSVREVRTRSTLSWAFRTWRTGMQNHAAARRHWERWLLVCCVTQWSGVVCVQRGTAILQRRAEHFRTNCLLIRCFSTWQKRSRVKFVFWEPEDGARLESRVVWLRRRAEKQRLGRSFVLWAARVRQNLAVHQYRHRTVLTRVFVAWVTWVRLDQERRLRALQWGGGRLCRAVLGRWRTCMQQQQEVRRRRARGLLLLAREILHRWHSYAQNKTRLGQLLCEHAERKRRMRKSRALLSWAEEAERLRSADISAQRSLKIRFLRQWRSRAVCGARVRRAVSSLEKERTRRALRSAFSLWRERRQLAEQRLLGRVRAAARRWRQRALRSRAESHRAGQLTSRALLGWRRALARRGEGRRRAEAVARQWLRSARLSHSRQQGALAAQQRRHRRGLEEGFRRWAAAYRSNAASDAFHAQRQSRRVLLAWRRLTVAVLTDRSVAVCFQAGLQERLRACCFSRWRSALQRAQGSLLLLEHALHRRRQRATLAALQYWRTATRGRLMQRNLNRSRLQKLFGCWKQKMEAIKAADVLCVERDRRGTRSVLVFWLRWAKESKARRQMGEAVWLWVQGRRVSGTFYLWVRASRQNTEASQLSCTRLLQRCLREWRLAGKTERRALDAAEERVRTLQLYASFCTWKKRTISQQALHINIQQARAGQERRLLSASVRAWHRQAEAQRWRSLHLSQKYLSLWVRAVRITHSRTQSQVEQSEEEEEEGQSRLSQKYLRRWQQRVLQRRFVRRRAQLLWTSWRNQAEAAALVRRMCDHRLLERAWLTWRKRRVRTRVSVAFAANHSRALLAQAFGAWRDRAL